MRSPRGISLLLLLLILTLLHQGWAAFSSEKPPAFSATDAQGVWVELQSGFPAPGVHQFPDGSTPWSVIQMTIPGMRLQHPEEGQPQNPLCSGEVLNLVESKEENLLLVRGWMSAGQRMAMGIPLHPDAMVLSDWEFLPGAGPSLARAIEEDRQSNGDFGIFSALERVRGVGPKRIAAWKEFF